MKHLTLHTRMQIKTYLHLGLKPAQIGRIIGRHRSTVQRELQRNSIHGIYQPHIADHLAKIRKIDAAMSPRWGKEVASHMPLKYHLPKWISLFQQRKKYGTQRPWVDRRLYFWYSDLPSSLSDFRRKYWIHFPIPRRWPKYFCARVKPLGVNAYLQLKKELKRWLTQLFSHKEETATVKVSTVQFLSSPSNNSLEAPTQEMILLWPKSA